MAGRSGPPGSQGRRASPSGMPIVGQMSASVSSTPKSATASRSERGDAGPGVDEGHVEVEADDEVHPSSLGGRGRPADRGRGWATSVLRGTMGWMTQTTGTAAGRLRELWTEVPRPGRLLLVAVVVDSVGFGLTLPFTVVYLHEVRGIPLPTVGPADVAAARRGPAAARTDRHAPSTGSELGACRWPRSASRCLGQLGLTVVHGPASRRGARWRSAASARRRSSRPTWRSSRRSCPPSSARATSGSTSRCSTPASASAGWCRGWSSTSTGPGPSWRSTSPTGRATGAAA